MRRAPHPLRRHISRQTLQPHLKVCGFRMKLLAGSVNKLGPLLGTFALLAAVLRQCVARPGQPRLEQHLTVLIHNEPDCCGDIHLPRPRPADGERLPLVGVEDPHDEGAAPRECHLGHLEP